MLRKRRDWNSYQQLGDAVIGLAIKDLGSPIMQDALSAYAFLCAMTPDQYDTLKFWCLVADHDADDLARQIRSKSLEEWKAWWRDRRATV